MHAHIFLKELKIVVTTCLFSAVIDGDPIKPYSATTMTVKESKVIKAQEPPRSTPDYKQAISSILLFTL